MPDSKKEAIIRVENVTAAYDQQVIIKDVSFEVYRGEGLCGSGWIGLRQKHAHETDDRFGKLPTTGDVYIAGEKHGRVTWAATSWHTTQNWSNVPEWGSFRLHDPPGKCQPSSGRIH